MCLDHADQGVPLPGLYLLVVEVSLSVGCGSAQAAHCGLAACQQALEEFEGGIGIGRYRNGHFPFKKTVV